MSVSIFSLTILSRQLIPIFYVFGPGLLDLNDTLHVAFGFKYVILSRALFWVKGKSSALV